MSIAPSIYDIRVTDFRPIAHRIENAALPVIVIYCSPKDYPDLYVARMHAFHSTELYSTDYIALSDTLEDLRDLMVPGMFCFNRDDADDPCIVETWL